MKKIRLDQLICDKGLAESREKAKISIMCGDVYVNGQKALKPGTPTDPESQIEIRGEALPFVSRGGFKLDKALKVFPVNVNNKICIDCGASTGGFTDVLLQNGAKYVYSVDVGYGQLAWKLREDPRVNCIERTNVRYIDDAIIPEKVDIAVMDLSFISITKVLPAVKNVIKPGADIICLIKPQFEAGKEKVGKNGVVTDKQTHIDVINLIINYVKDINLTVCGLDFSPIKGPKGNIEYLCWLKNELNENKPIDILDVVNKSHELNKNV